MNLNERDYALFDSYFHPKTIAIVGATDSPFSGGSGFLNALISSHFPKDRIFPINNHKSELLGIQTYPTLSAVPVPIDYVIIAVPRKYILEVVKECVQIGIKVGTIFTSGFTEIGDTALEKQLVEVARKGNMRLIGPNCIGLYIPEERVTFIVNLPVGEENAGRLGVISQSGGLADMFSFMGHYRGVKFSKVVSFGNGCDLHCPDFLEYFEQDPKTEMIFIYLEGFKNQAQGQKFRQVASRVVKQKPIIFWKGGKSEAGQGAIFSHTGSLSGNNEILESLAKQIGLVDVSNQEEVIDTLTAFYYLKERLPIGRRLAVIGGGGGNTVATSDTLSKAGFELPANPKRIQEEIIKIIGEVGVIVRNPIDLNVFIWDGKKLCDVVQIMGTLENIDLLIFDAGIDWGFNFERAFGLKNVIEPTFKSVLLVLKKIKETMPVAAVFPTVFYEREIVGKKMEFELMVQELGIPVFQTMSRCAFALNKLVRYGEQFR
jgi:acyl-CoA synthetase (NDP forming)